MVAAHAGFERWIEAYSHDGRIGVLVELASHDSFAAKTDEFRRAARDVALQVAAMAPESVDALLAQDCLKQPGASVAEYLEATSMLLGDRIHVVRFERWVAMAQRPVPELDPPRSPAGVVRMLRSA